MTEANVRKEIARAAGVCEGNVVATSPLLEDVGPCTLPQLCAYPDAEASEISDSKTLRTNLIVESPICETPNREVLGQGTLKTKSHDRVCNSRSSARFDHVSIFALGVKFATTPRDH